jgi:DNA-binding NarL/FixJ family response regulator
MKDFILADNQALTQAGIRQLLERPLGVGNVVSVGCKQELVRELLHYPQARVALDYALFDFSQAEELLNLCDRFPQAQFLLVSADLSDAFIRRILLLSKNIGIIFKNCTCDEMLEALRMTLRGEPYLCPYAQELLRLPETPPEPNPLTRTEVEILQLLAVGKSSKEIAALRFISQYTVVTHRKNIFRKLAVNTVYEAARKAIRMGLVSPAEYSI